MHDKPGRLGRPPRKSSTADSVLFEKEDDFCTTFESAVGRSACGLAHDSCTYICVNLKIFIIYHRNVLFSIKTLNSSAS